MGKHLTKRNIKLCGELFGYKTKNTAVDLKNGTSFGPTCFTTNHGEVIFVKL
jgi:hypothetical protein